MVFPVYPYRPYTQGFDYGFQWSPQVTGTRYRIIPDANTKYKIVADAHTR